MIVEVKNNRKASLRTLQSTDMEDILAYLENLGPDTKKRFGPHPFNRQAINELCTDKSNTGFIARDCLSGKIIAYAIIRTGYLDHDKKRLSSYGLQLSKETDCTFAPSVADEWQGLGVGHVLFHFIVTALKEKGINRIILWGGVQAGNLRAVNYYRKLGFTLLGEFEYYGKNYDMLKTI